MAKEIERKFLVTDTAYRKNCKRKIHIIQAYLSTRIDATVRVRISGDEAWICVKGRNDGAVRDEWEYRIPMEDAMDMVEKCSVGTVIDKTRYIVAPWEIDEFHGALSGLTIAEIELPAENVTIDLPEFIGREVTGDPRYYNSSLSVAGMPPVD